MASQHVVFVGIKGHVLAVDRTTGAEIWRTALTGSGFVNVAVTETDLYAATRGELFAIDPASGAIRWHNALKGLGLGLLTIAAPGAGQFVVVADQRRRDDTAAAASASAAAG